MLSVCRVYNIRYIHLNSNVTRELKKASLVETPSKTSLLHVMGTLKKKTSMNYEDLGLLGMK